jgi:hypothetical protein
VANTHRSFPYSKLNIANYGNPGNNIQNVSAFEQITSVRGRERRIQLALHYNF